LGIESSETKTKKKRKKKSGIELIHSFEMTFSIHELCMTIFLKANSRLWCAGRGDIKALIFASFQFHDQILRER